MKFNLPGKDLLKRFKKGDDDDFEDDEEEFEDDADFDVDDDEEGAAPPPATGSDDDDDMDLDEDDEDYDDEDEEDEEDLFGGGGSRFGDLADKILGPLSGLTPQINAVLGTGKRRLIILGVAGVVGLGLFSGLGAMMFLGGDEPDEVVEETAEPDQEGAAGLGAKLMQRSDSIGIPPEPGVQQATIGEAIPPRAEQPMAPRSLNEIAAQDVSSTATGIQVASVPADAFSKIPASSQGERPLTEGPEPGLLEQTENGLLPRIDPAGRMPWQVYARPVQLPSDQPRVAIIVTGLGLSATATEASIKRLPGAVTLAFDPYATDLETWVPLARQTGHELLLTIPMATEDFPIQDPGPLALQVAADPEQNVALMEGLLGRMSTYVGVLTAMGSSLLTRDDQIRPVIETLKNRGLMYVDGGVVEKTLAPTVATELGVPRAMVTMRLDRDPSRTAIDARLTDLERLARSQAFVVGITAAYPTALERINAWVPTLGQKGVALAPITAIADKQVLQ